HHRTHGRNKQEDEEHWHRNSRALSCFLVRSLVGVIVQISSSSAHTVILGAIAYLHISVHRLPAPISATSATTRAHFSWFAKQFLAHLVPKRFWVLNRIQVRAVIEFIII